MKVSKIPLVAVSTLIVGCGSSDSSSTSFGAFTPPPATTGKSDTVAGDAESTADNETSTTTVAPTTSGPAASSDSTGEGTSDGNSSTTGPVGVGYDECGILQIYQPTSAEPIELQFGDHDNGDRYNANHEFINYEVTAYFFTADTEIMEMKTDGPNHGGCEDLPECMWTEPAIVMENGQARIGSEWPHPDNHGPHECPSCVTFGENLNERWVGYKIIAYANPEGYRVYEQWLDPDGMDDNQVPANNWILMMRETDVGQVLPEDELPRELPIDFDEGLEAEFRMHRGFDTQIECGFVQEIESPL